MLNILQVLQVDFEILNAHEFKTMIEKIEEIGKLHDALRHEVDQLKSDMAAETEKITSLQENQETVRIRVERIEQDIRQKEDQIREVYVHLRFIFLWSTDYPTYVSYLSI